MNNHLLPHVTAILAISLNGKISIDTNTPARFSSTEDLAHLEVQISLCDAIVFGANTLRAYGTSLTIKNPQLLERRKKESKPPQPLHIVCSASGNLNPDWSFFAQPLPRALLTNEIGKNNWLKLLQSQKLIAEKKTFFEHFFLSNNKVKWQETLIKLRALKYHKIAILGGAKLISSLLKENLIDDIWLTVCPVIIGQEDAPNLIDNSLFHEGENLFKLKKILELRQIGNEIFVHYLIKNRD